MNIQIHPKITTLNLAPNFGKKKQKQKNQVKSALNIQTRRPQKVAAGCGGNAIGKSQRINRPPNNHCNSRRDEVEKKSQQ